MELTTSRDAKRTVSGAVAALFAMHETAFAIVRAKGAKAGAGATAAARVTVTAPATAA